MSDARKLRADSRWNDFSEAEREHIRHMLDEGCELSQIGAYCKQISKPWSLGKISKFFTKERRAVLAEDLNTRRETASLQAIIEATRAGGFELDEFGQLTAARKLQLVMLAKQADPETPEGRKIINDAAWAINDIRRVNVSEQQGEKRLEQQGQALKLALDKFQFDAAQAALKVLPELRKIAGDKSLNASGRIDAVRKALFGQVAA